VARFIAGVAAKGLAMPGLWWTLTDVNGTPGLAAWMGVEPYLAMSLVVAEGRIEQVLVVANPDKLAGLGAPPPQAP
jgi:RNA polymerase sigma-70 factor, ECF subfamily